MKTNTSKQLWWGYLHINGSVQVKRYFEPLDIKEANESDFVNRTFEPFYAYNREDAIKQIENIIK